LKKAADSGPIFQRAQDEARTIMRARRHIAQGRDEDFFSWRRFLLRLLPGEPRSQARPDRLLGYE
jgi:hypothetical protein